MIRAQVAGPDEPIRHEEIPGLEVPPVRVISGADFVACFTPAETAALLAIPELAQGALLAAAQGEVNLDSPRFAALMQLAVARGALTPERAVAVARGEAAENAARVRGPD